MRVAAPAWKFFVPLMLAGLAALAAALLLSIPSLIAVFALLAILALYVLYFFRDPGRKLPDGIADGYICPADGKVVSVIEVPEERLPEGRARRVAIFLNVFNVHIQRAPHAGTIREIVRKEGKFINALNEKCSEENEQVTLWLDGANGQTYGIRQIAGAIARRIVVWFPEGEKVAQSERYGLIQFGSRVEIFLPLGAEVLVKPGQIVRGGSTLLASAPKAAAGTAQGAIETAEPSTV